MSEHFTDAQVDHADGTHEVEPTGHDDVDRVVASLDGLDGRPVSEHVAVFESAHDTAPQRPRRRGQRLLRRLSRSRAPRARAAPAAPGRRAGPPRTGPVA